MFRVLHAAILIMWVVVVVVVVGVGVGVGVVVVVVCCCCCCFCLVWAIFNGIKLEVTAQNGESFQIADVIEVSMLEFSTARLQETHY